MQFNCLFILNVELNHKLGIKDLKLSKLRNFNAFVIIALISCISLPGHLNTNNDAM